MSGFLKEVKRCSGSIFIFSYRGDGWFLVNVLNEDAMEIEYTPLRSNARAPIFNQGKYYISNISFQKTISQKKLLYFNFIKDIHTILQTKEVE